MKILQAIAPAPLWSATLLALWLLLAGSTSPGHLLVGLAIGLIVPPLTVHARVAPGRLRRPGVMARYLATVALDAVRSTVEVAWGLLNWRRRRPDSRFVIIPLDLRDPVGLALLAMVTTAVPGTAWAELAMDRATLLLHVWDVRDEAAFVARYKERYEKPLREIFE